MPELYRFSEDSRIETFRPRHASGQEHRPPCVWAIDAAHAPLYWFPRDCPRIAFWAGAGTTAAERERFLGLGTAERVHVTEQVWLERLRRCRLYVYSFEAAPSERSPDASGYHVAHTEAAPLRSG